mmetsp:Transcript_13083/g.17918  ORF Transcript_13083/g.17918 Transcript_13083/m.17918 type:complete len:107 (+) Transcript_13083:359-679(+)
MEEFGFKGLNGTLTQYNGFIKDDGKDDICTSAASAKFWFHNVAIVDSHTKPFSACILSPHQLVLNYLAAVSEQNQRTDDDKEGDVEEAIPITACSNNNSAGVHFSN